MSYLFDFECFLDELRENPKKRSLVEKYEEWAKKGSLEDQDFFQHYLSQFKPIQYDIPEELKEDFDWALLQILVCASFSSTYVLHHDNFDMPELVITVQSGNQSVTKTVSELWSFQILRLYEIFVEEQLNLESLRVKYKRVELVDGIVRVFTILISDYKNHISLLEKPCDHLDERFDIIEKINTAIEEIVEVYFDIRSPYYNQLVEESVYLFGIFISERTNIDYLLEILKKNSIEIIVKKFKENIKEQFYKESQFVEKKRNEKISEYISKLQHLKIEKIKREREKILNS